MACTTAALPPYNPELDVSYLGSLSKIVVSFNTLSFYYYHYVNELARLAGRDFLLRLSISSTITSFAFPVELPGVEPRTSCLQPQKLSGLAS